MKSFFRFSIIGLLFISQASLGQDTLALINSNWDNLKTQLQRRTVIVTNMTKILSRSSKVDKGQLEKSKGLSYELFNIVDTLTLANGQSISVAADINNKLTQTLSRIIVTLELDQKFKSRKDVRKLMMKLEGCENGIALAKKEYNDTCILYGRLNLLFNKL